MRIAVMYKLARNSDECRVKKVIMFFKGHGHHCLNPAVITPTSAWGGKENA